MSTIERLLSGLFGSVRTILPQPVTNIAEVYRNCLRFTGHPLYRILPDKNNLVSSFSILVFFVFPVSFVLRFQECHIVTLAIQKRLHPWLCDPAPVVCRHRNDVYWDASAAVVRFFPIIRLRSCICFLFFVSSSLNPFKGTIAFEHIGCSVVIRIDSKGTSVLEFLMMSKRSCTQDCC